MDRAPFFERQAGWLFGAQLAQVVSLADPENLNRVQIRLLAFDGIDGQDMPLWARVVSPFAGDDRGAFFMPDVGDEVLVVFVQGDPRYPLIVGGLWSGSNAAPASIGAGGNVVKRIRTKNGLQLTLEDSQGQETIKLETPGGQSVTLRDGAGAILFEDSSGNAIRLQPGSLSIVAASQVKIQAPIVKVTAGIVKVDSAMAKFSGVVKCQTLIATSVVSTTYTPGAGNVW